MEVSAKQDVEPQTRRKSWCIYGEERALYRVLSTRGALKRRPFAAVKTISNIFLPKQYDERRLQSCEVEW